MSIRLALVIFLALFAFTGCDDAKQAEKSPASANGHMEEVREPPAPPAGSDGGGGFMPRLAIPPSAVPPPASAVSEAEKAEPNYAIVDIFFATDRKIDAEAKLEKRFTNDRGDLVYGVAKVSVPADHKTGEMERPMLYKLEFRENPEKHIVLRSAEVIPGMDYFKQFNEQLSKRPGKMAFIFVHGYNVSFKDAAMRTAQLAYDLEFEGLPVLYSWPSRGKFAQYTVDQTSVVQTIPHLQAFFERFAMESDAEQIFVIAHSMGGEAATVALLAAVQNQPALKGRYKELVLAAPDIDAVNFKEKIAPGFAALSNPVTLYASSADKALKASKAVNGYQRAGDSVPTIVVAPNVESIDATAADTDFLGHSNFANNRILITDMASLISNGIRADKRYGLRPIPNHPIPYWKLKP